MTSDRKKPTAGFWITIALVAVLVGYPLSFGPACWVGARIDVTDTGRTVLMCLYYPLFWTAKDGPACIQEPLIWWKGLGKPPMEMIVLPEPPEPVIE